MHSLKYFGYVNKENLLFSHLGCRWEWAGAHHQPHLQHTTWLLCNLWHVAGFQVPGTAEAGGPSHICNAAYIVPDLCASATVLPEHLLPFGLCSFPTLSQPCFVGRDAFRVSQKQSVAKGNQIFWAVVAALTRAEGYLVLEWFGWICSSCNFSGGIALISRVPSCWCGWLDFVASCSCRLFPLHGEIILYNDCNLSQL